MKKTITTVLYIMLFVFSTGLALLSVCMGKITVAETTILPTGFSMVVGLLLVFLTVNTVGLPIAVMILDKRLLKKIIALTLVLLMALGMAGFAKDNADTSPFDFVLTGNSSGYGQTDEWLPSSSLKLTADTSDEESIAVLLSAVLDGSQPLDLALAFEKEQYEKLKKHAKFVPSGGQCPGQGEGRTRGLHLEWCEQSAPLLGGGRLC